MIDRAAILAEFIALNDVPVRQDDEFTLAEYRAGLLASGQPISDEGAKYRLRKQAEAGTLTTRLAYVPEKQRTCRVWRKIHESSAGG